MRISHCAECHEYKYIEKDGKCPTCLESWMVIFRGPHKANHTDIVDQDLSKDEALQKAQRSVYYIAKPQKN